MQIVIDINEHIYEQIMADSEVYVLDNDVDQILIENAIYNGTPLPKNHGRLIDESKINIPYDICDGNEAVEFIKETPTIIEADKESEEE